MSQTKTWACTASTVIRREDDGTGGQGCGGSTRLYVGRYGSAGTRRNYDSYLKFANDYVGVKSIVSAVLNVYTDDGGDLMPLPATGDTPKVYVRRLTDSFTEGNNADGEFDSTDYTSAAADASGAKSAAMQKAANLVTSINITAIVKAWAPSTVAGAGKKANHGLMLSGYDSSLQNWAGWSRHASALLRPTIVLTYELGPTTPGTPATNMAPSGATAAISTFEGDFTDPRPEDTLKTTQVQVYTSSAVKSGTAVASSNTITSNSHGFLNGQEVWFHSLTGGAGLSTGTRYYVAAKTANTFKVVKKLGDPSADITTDYSALTVAHPIWAKTHTASDSEKVAGHFAVPRDGLALTTGTTYKWRARVEDQEDQWSLWSALISFSVTNTVPVAPVCNPVSGYSTATLNGLWFRGGTFSDADGDALGAFQVQMSAYPSGNPNWDDATFILWDTGKQYVASGATSWQTLYTGMPLDAGTYYWRARHWDDRDGLSAWTYATIVLSAPFEPEPGQDPTVRFDPQSPWRVVIKEMKFNAVGGALSGVSATDVITTTTNHGFAANRKVRFSALTGGAGLVLGQNYFVLSSGLGLKTFKVGLTAGGAAVDFTTAITAGTVTAVTTRGPGNIVAIFEHAKSVGSSVVYNSPGEMHFTLVKDDPQISVVEPRQTHYSVQFYSGDGWRETFAGLVTDFDAVDTGGTIIKGIDYLGLLDYTMDERYFPSDPNRSYAKGGSYYVNKTLREVVFDQLRLAVRVPNSPVGFITVADNATIATMTEKVSIYSTMQPVLGLVGGLLDSHRQGTGKRTRVQVKRVGAGSYQFYVTDDPGVVRNNLRLRYGELVNGYRAIPFGQTWSSVLNAIGRTRDGIKVLYRSFNAPGIDQTTWGRWARAVIMDNVSDELDLERRGKQTAIQGGKLGQNMGIAVRTGFLKPLDGYDICDEFNVVIDDGAVNTDNWGSGYWVNFGVAWEAGDDASQNVSLTLLPRDDTVAPASDLIDSNPISTQAEWQVGWTPPVPATASARYWLDQNTGIVYERTESATEVTLSPSAAGDTFTAPSHGLIAHDTIIPVIIYGGGVGLTTGAVYYVLASGLTAGTFKISETDGGAAITFAEDITEGAFIGTPVYTVVTDGVMDPPVAPSAPSAPTLTSSATSGVVRLKVVV